MEYINIKLETVGDFRYIGSKPVLRATWLNLLVYCAKQENSGIIVNCRAWGNDTWAQIAGLRRSEVHTPSQLWSWEGDDLHVWGYPIQNQERVKTLRTTGRLGGKASGESRRSTKPEANASPSAEPNASPNAPANLEQKGKEEKGKESNVERESTPASPASELNLQADAIAATYCRQDSPLEVRQLILDDLLLGTTTAEIRDGVARCMRHIRSAPQGSANRFVPKALSFFSERQWRSPEAFQERWTKDAPPTPSRRQTDEIPSTAKVTTLQKL